MDDLEEEPLSLEQQEASLREYTQQYEEIKALIANDPQNEELLKIEKDLEDCITLTADVIYETKKALGLIEADDPKAVEADANEAEETDLASAFPPGSLIDAKYFEDDQFYPAQVVGVTETGYIVRFDGYNNEEEVAPDAIRFRETKQGEEEKPKKKRKAESEDPYANIPTQVPERFKIKPDDPEDVKQRKKKQAHSIKSKIRFAKQAKEQDSKKSNWQGFLKGKGSKRKKGYLTSTNKESIFKSPDSLDGKVGVVGSGKGMTNYTERVRHDFQD